MKIRVTTDKYEYQGLYKGSEHEVDSVGVDSVSQLMFYTVVNKGKYWKLYEGDCEEVPAPNEKLLDVINTDLKQDSVLDIQHGGSHYKDKKIQPIEYITANNLDFCEGNIVKYASRHKEKNGAEDIRKVIHYAQFILKFQYGEDI